MSDETSAPDLAGTGIWSGDLRYGDAGLAADAAAELETLGFGALWIPDVGGDVFGAVANLLQATSTITVGTGILNLWMHSAEETAAQHAALTEAHGDRFMVGVGVSHAPIVNNVHDDGAYTKPLAKTAGYLDELDAARPPLAKSHRLLAALGPKMLELAATRAAGVHPYLVTPEHTQAARKAVGPDAVVAPEQGVIFETDADKARSIARANLVHYIGLPNYQNNWVRLGYDESDFADGGSDRLIDALVAWGDEDAILARIQAHRDAGASHVAVQVMAETRDLPRETWRSLAAIAL